MADIFLKVVNLSFSASWLVLAVIAARFLLKKAPKWVNVLLWGLVAIRLLCPFSLESALSLIPSSEVVSPQIIMDRTPSIQTGIDPINTVVNEAITESFTPNPATSANPLQIWIPIWAVLWIVGMAAMAEYTLFTWLRLRRRVRLAVRVNGNVYLSENIDSPFVLGVFRPRIYIPYGMPQLDMYHVIAHERTHIRRRDHWWKPLGFTLLAVHWFNPLMWVAYILLCRDIELACDERVIKQMKPEQRANYSQALLNCSVRHRSIAACPVAFGEVGVKDRVKRVLTYRKPAFWIIVISLVLCVVVALCFMTDPKEPDSLDWLQNLSHDQVNYIEFYFYDAAPDKQYTRYEEKNVLYQVVKTLNRFDGANATQEDVQGFYGSRYTINIVLEDGTSHTLINHANGYLQIDDNFFEDTYFILNTWDPYFQGTTYLPGNEPGGDSFYGVSLQVEEANANGATVVFTGTGEAPSGRLMGGNDYWVQVEKDGIWEDVVKAPEPSFTTNAYDIDNVRRHKIDWQWRYGTLSRGHYRIGKDVTYQEGAKPLETATVWAEFTLDSETADAYAILSNLIPDGARAESTFASGGGYNCFPDEAESLVQILNSIEESELRISPEMSPIISLTLFANNDVTMHYNGTYVQFAFTGTAQETRWAVKHEKLNAFFEKINANSPENSTYEIYNVAPLEDLPEHYSIEEAMIDKVVIHLEGDASYNQDVWQEFVDSATQHIPATVRVMKFYLSNGEAGSFKTIYELVYDGEDYTLSEAWNGITYTDRYKYLYFYHVDAGEDADYDGFDCYYLTNIHAASYDQLLNTYSHDAFNIYTDLIYLPKKPQLPNADQIQLRINGLPLVTLAGYQQTEHLMELLNSAEYLGYEPKTYNLGPDLVLMGSDGTSLTLNLDLDSDLFRLDGLFYDYGPGYNSNGGINNLPVLLGMLGLENWPEEVRKAFPNYFLEIGDAAIPPANDLVSGTGNYIINVWYPDWAYLELGSGQANRLLKALEQEAPNPVDETIPDVPDTVFTIHIAFDGGQEFDLAYMGQADFYLRDFKTNQVYRFSSEGLRIAVDNAISETKAILND